MVKGLQRMAAGNSFGRGGSNVQVFLSEATLTPSFEVESFKRKNNVITITARSLKALKKLSYLYCEWIKDNAEEMDEHFVENLCYSFNEHRSLYPHRLALTFGTAFEASHSLEAFADDFAGWQTFVAYAKVTSSDRKVVFMFGGQGLEWYAMGRQLMEYETVFKEAILTVGRLLKDMGETWSLEDELMAPKDVSQMTECYIAQTATFAVQYATAQLLKSWKILPSAVIGQSFGELAAACVSGIITVKEALQLVVIRSTLHDSCPKNGGMAALGLCEAKARDLLLNLRLNATLDIAAVNDADGVTVAGDLKFIEALGEHLSVNARDVYWRVYGTNRAFHSSQMEPIKIPFQEALKRVQLKPQLSKIPMYSCVEGEIVSGQQLNNDYWWRNIRCPVRFYSAMKHLLRDGYRQIIEISMQPFLFRHVNRIALQENLTERERPVVFTTLPHKTVPIEDQHKYFLQNTVCKLFTVGFPIHWNSVEGNRSARFIRSETSPRLESSSCYREHPPQPKEQPISSRETIKRPTHPYLSKVKTTDLCLRLHCWETENDLLNITSLKNHDLIEGGAVMSGVAYREMAFAMVNDKFVHILSLDLGNVKLSSPPTLPKTQVGSLSPRLLTTGSSENWGEVRNPAAPYVQLIVKEQRHGSYFLGEYSYGRFQSVEYPVIDTLPWSSRSQNITIRLFSITKDGRLTSRHVQTLREALLKNQTIFNKEYQEWQPAEVRRPLSFLKCQNNRFLPRNPTTYGIEEVWSQLVDKGSTVLVCPGDHYSLSELPRAQVTGGILATAPAINCCMLLPELPTLPRMFTQRRAVEKLSGGVHVGVFLHSKRGNKMPRYRDLFFREDFHKLELRSKPGEREAIQNEETKKDHGSERNLTWCSQEGSSPVP